MDQSAARRLMTRCRRGAVPYVHGRGWRWLQREFLPALEFLAAGRNRSDRDLAAEGCYLLGDVHDFNEAPRAAVRAYRRAIRLHPDFASAWREMGCLNERMGARERARTALRRAVRLDPGDRLARADLECLEEGPTPPIFIGGNPVWESSEWLAQGRVRAAIEVLSGLRSNQARAARARAYAVQGDLQASMQEWALIAEARGPVSMRPADWFYTGDLLWNHAPFWESLLRLGRRAHVDGVWGVPLCLWKAVPDLRKRIEVYARYHLARLARDTRTLAALAHLYPQWKEVRSRR